MGCATARQRREVNTVASIARKPRRAVFWKSDAAANTPRAAESSRAVFLSYSLVSQVLESLSFFSTPRLGEFWLAPFWPICPDQFRVPKCRECKPGDPADRFQYFYDRRGYGHLRYTQQPLILAILHGDGFECVLKFLPTAALPALNASD